MYITDRPANALGLGLIPGSFFRYVTKAPATTTAPPVPVLPPPGSTTLPTPVLPPPTTTTPTASTGTSSIYRAWKAKSDPFAAISQTFRAGAAKRGGPGSASTFVRRIAEGEIAAGRLVAKRINVVNDKGETVTTTVLVKPEDAAPSGAPTTEPIQAGVTAPGGFDTKTMMLIGLGLSAVFLVFDMMNRPKKRRA